MVNVGLQVEMVYPIQQLQLVHIFLVNLSSRSMLKCCIGKEQRFEEYVEMLHRERASI